MGIASWQPLDLARFEFSRHGSSAFNIAAQVKIADRHQQVRTIMVMAGNGSARIEIDLGDAHAILHEENFDANTREGLVAAFHWPTGDRRSHLLILEQFNRHVAKRLLPEILRDVREISRRKARVP